MKISIITAALNSEATIRDTFESILNQTHTDIESIVIDGASTDGTMQIVKEYEPRFNGRMRYISEPDNGIYDAMNKGLSMVTGEVVGILNSDDFYTSSDILSSVAATLKSSEVDAVYGDIHYENDNHMGTCVRYYSSRIFTRGLMRYGFMPAHPSFYCKRKIYNRHGGFDTNYRIAADFENLLRLIYINRIRTKYIKKDFVTMRTGGISTNGLSSYWKIMREQQKALKDNKVYSNIMFFAVRYMYKIYEVLSSRIKLRLHK